MECTGDSVREVRMASGHVALVDCVDWPLVAGRSWFPHVTAPGRQPYAHCWSWESGSRKKLYMHRLILKPEGRLHVDHINGNTLDNRRCNIRVATVSQNIANSRPISGCSSQFKGVSLFRSGKWVAYITHCSTRMHLGYFASQEAAARAYDTKALELFGEFARLNFPLAGASHA